MSHLTLWLQPWPQPLHNSNNIIDNSNIIIINKYNSNTSKNNYNTNKSRNYNKSRSRSRSENKSRTDNHNQGLYRQQTRFLHLSHGPQSLHLWTSRHQWQLHI